MDPPTTEIDEYTRPVIAMRRRRRARHLTRRARTVLTLALIATSVVILLGYLEAVIPAVGVWLVVVMLLREWALLRERVRRLEDGWW
jgi:heme O synthase-like polyprenyltransferase